jgi:NADH-quinone oxidoreductase subunit B
MINDGLEGKLPEGVILGSVEKIVGAIRGNSVWPVTMGLACCAIEMMAAGGPKYDMARYGLEVFRASPRQADMMIVSGRVSYKMAPVVRRVYDQLSDPKWVISMGACATSGGTFNNYAVVQGCDHFLPVDIYLPGCPPRPEALINTFVEMFKYIDKTTVLGPNRVKIAQKIQDAADAQN